MDKLNNAQLELREMDELAAADSPVHRLNPLCKLLVTVFYIAAGGHGKGKRQRQEHHILQVTAMGL